MKKAISIFCIISLMTLSTQAQISLKDLLKNMTDLSTLPELNHSKTAMASTWDRNGGNNDDADFKHLHGSHNVLLDIDGPGSIFRIFTGTLRAPQNPNIDFNRTNLQIFIDHDTVPVIDQPIEEFFADNDFTAYPFVFGNDRTYPGFLLPIPFRKHIKVQLYSKDDYPVFANWGNYWQVTYTKYSPKTDIKSFSLPLTAEEKDQMKKTGRYLKQAEKTDFTKPDKWDEIKIFDLKNKQKITYSLKGPQTLTALEVNVTPNTPEALKAVRFRIYWDDKSDPSVDAPLGYFFGNADYGSENQYGSLLMGVNNKGGYTFFPMPFQKKAKITFSVPDSVTVDEIQIKLNHDHKKIPDNYGYFHASWNEDWMTAEKKREKKSIAQLNIPNIPKVGPKNIPFYTVLKRKGIQGKYVGVMLHVAWPGDTWWGEGDWITWSDENQWPPSYHGTGTEEYFNSGWCDFDRKAISGYVHKKYPSNVIVYSFHLNDAFNFQEQFKTGVERWNLFSKDDTQRTIWGSTAFWYARDPQPAKSKKHLLTPRFNGKKLKWE